MIVFPQNYKNMCTTIYQLLYQTSEPKNHSFDPFSQAIYYHSLNNDKKFYLYARRAFHSLLVKSQQIPVVLAAAPAVLAPIAPMLPIPMTGFMPPIPIPMLPKPWLGKPPCPAQGVFQAPPPIPEKQTNNKIFYRAIYNKVALNFPLYCSVIL